jgi:hypothetical protein
MKMKLYKVTADGILPEHIVATTEGNAIVKYEEVNPRKESYDVTAEYICNRDDIVPTIEPIHEFKSHD